MALNEAAQDWKEVSFYSQLAQLAPWRSANQVYSDQELKRTSSEGSQFISSGKE